MQGNSNTKQLFAEVNTPEFLKMLLTHGELRNRAFRKLVDITHGPLTYYIKRFVSSSEEAQEVLQEVYLGVHKGVDTFQGKSKLTTWIYGMAHYKICDKLSDKSWQHEEFEEFKMGESADPGSSHISNKSEWELSPDKHYDLQKMQGRIKVAVEKLSPALREVYYLRDVQFMNGSDVAEALEISEEAVRVRLHRARNQIVDIVHHDSQGSIKSGVKMEAV